MDKGFKRWCAEVAKLGYKPQPDHELEWLEWYEAGLTPQQAYREELLLWAAT